MNNECKCGQMTCPNCGMNRNTDLEPCTCGWNPLSESCKDMEKEIKENSVVSNKTTINDNFEQKKLDFYIRNNINWLQYILIELIINFKFTDEEYEKFYKYITIGMDECTKMYNAVPRIMQGNRIKGLSPTVKREFEDTFGFMKGWKSVFIEEILLGNYDIPYLNMDKL